MTPFDQAMAMVDKQSAVMQQAQEVMAQAYSRITTLEGQNAMLLSSLDTFRSLNEEKERKIESLERKIENQKEAIKNLKKVIANNDIHCEDCDQTLEETEMEYGICINCARALS